MVVPGSHRDRSPAGPHEELAATADGRGRETAVASTGWPCVGANLRIGRGVDPSYGQRLLQKGRA
jgi:hypothetical protein